MKFIDAKNKLKKLASGKYHSIGYNLTEFADGGLDAKCSLYIDPRISVSATTWKEALGKMKEIEISKTNKDFSFINGQLL